MFFVFATLISVGYFGLLLVPEFWPDFDSFAYFAYQLSLPFTLAILAFLGAWGVARVALARHSNQPATRRQLRLIAITSIAFFVFFAFACVRTLIGYGLPAGSCLLAFDAAAWQEPASSEFVSHGITPRQKMLHQVVRKVIPGRTRAEVEELLGPSLEAPYFQSTGRDLIYVTGPQRDSLFAIDSEWLLIWLDEHGRVARFDIVSD
jgi:hypothetical protein